MLVVLCLWNALVPNGTGVRADVKGQLLAGFMSIPDNFETTRSFRQLHYCTLDIDMFAVRVAVVAVVCTTNEVGLALELNGTSLFDPVAVEVELGVDIVKTLSQNMEFLLLALWPVVKHSFVIIHNQDCVSYNLIYIWGSWT